MKKISSTAIGVAALASLMAPLCAAAQINTYYINSYYGSIQNIINGVLVPLLFAIAFLYFVYGVYKYFILGADSEADRTKGRELVLWSVIGFAVILSVWGLVAVVINTLNIGGGGPPGVPTIEQPQ